MAQRHHTSPFAFIHPIPSANLSSPTHTPPTTCRLSSSSPPYLRPYTPLGSYPAFAPCFHPRPALSSAYLPPPPPGAPRAHRPDRPDDAGGDAWLRVLALWRAYNVSLEAAPLRTKAATAAVLNLLADAVAQALAGGVRDVDRLTRFAAFGGLVAGPMGHAWFGALEAVVRLGGVRGAVVKTAFDQLLFAPVLLGCFFGSMALLEGRGVEGVKGEVEGKLMGTLRTSWKIWPMINLINFGLVPPAMRVLFVNGLSVAWIAFLSMVNNEDDELVVASSDGI